MRSSIIFTALLLVSSDIRLPTAERSEPSSTVKQVPIDTMKPDEWYVIESTTPPLAVLTSPPGILEVESVTGPWTLRGRFAGGTKIETRTYTAQHLSIVTSIKPGTVELIVIPTGVETAEQIVRQSLTVSGSGPNPPPTPTPPVVKTFRVIFVKESGVTLSAAQSAIPDAYAIRTYLREKTTEWREYDPQQTTDTEPKALQELWAAVQPKINIVPCMVIEINGQADVLPFPTGASTALATLKKYGGE